MNLIVAVDKNWGIGNEGKLLERISEDMKYFKEKTINKTVIMGRVTFDSLPKRKPLKDRNNIVLSSKDETIDGVTLCKNINELFDSIKEIDDDNIFVIGGELIYEILLAWCNRAYVTKIHNEYISDKKMVNLDNSRNWKIVYESQIFENKNGVKFQFITYEKIY